MAGALATEAGRTNSHVVLLRAFKLLRLASGHVAARQQAEAASGPEARDPPPDLSQEGKQAPGLLLPELESEEAEALCSSVGILEVMETRMKIRCLDLDYL